ncbi:acyl-CoA dehydrogenase [Arthrobacter sp. TS-15]|uniref:acyl-CoA dehydrogenase family protein n=1 Tax=Arthrobacter sp. TS-15 TaxID=2510797 RepID=UPI00115DECB0|nr:acyl-CoA dehydrogenase [Arthrobacter sp. TS-15]TQS88921.1 acyl-CoA dehydrogenase [Arthrobacter sp. TS-15]
MSSQKYGSEQFEGLLERLDAITDLIKSEAPASEALGRPTDKVHQALLESGAYLIATPAELGGLEGSPTQVLQTVEKISYADASTGWSAMALLTLTGVAGAYLEDNNVIAELFRDGKYPLCAGQGTFPGSAVRDGDGYRISGHWRFASGFPLATHAFTAALTDDTGEMRIFIHPRDTVTEVDNWDVIGLRATGSIDYIGEDVYVPANYSFNVVTTDPVRGGAYYRLGVAGAAGVQHGAWALGVGRRLLDEMKELAAKRSKNPGSPINSEEFYAEFARAEAKFRSARAFLMETYRDLEPFIYAGEPLTQEQESLTRLALTNATWSVHEVSVFVHRWAGADVMRNTPVQRVWRDLHAGTQHASSGPSVVQSCGLMLSGLAPEGSQWIFFDLVKPQPAEPVLDPVGV